MLTPQQIQEISFEKAVFGGYNMDSVDDFLEPLTEDYVTLYKENSVLKSKMRILVEKLEEYRKQESSMQSAIIAAQKTCDQMIAEAEKKCARMLHEAEETVSAKTKNLDKQADLEEERLAVAKQATAQFLDSMEKRMKRQIEFIEELRNQELTDVPKEPAPYGKTISPSQEEKRAFDFDKSPSAPTTAEKADALIEEIGQRIEESLSTPSLGELVQQEMAAPAPAKEDKFRKFEDLQFGPNYHPTKK